MLDRLRSLCAPLLPSPDPVVDDTVKDWLTYAETVFFRCFEGVPGAESVDAAYRRLTRLSAEVETALETAGPHAVPLALRPGRSPPGRTPPSATTSCHGRRTGPVRPAWGSGR